MYIHTDADDDQLEQAEAISQAYMDLMNRMGMGPMLSAFSNAAGLPVF